MQVASCSWPCPGLQGALPAAPQNLLTTTAADTLASASAHILVKDQPDCLPKGSSHTVVRVGAQIAFLRRNGKNGDSSESGQDPPGRISSRHNIPLIMSGKEGLENLKGWGACDRHLING